MADNNNYNKSKISKMNLLKYRGISHYPVLHREVSQLVKEFALRVQNTKPQL